MHSIIFRVFQPVAIYLRTILFGCAIFVFNFKSFGFGQDTIILHNNQMLIGKVESASLGTITIDDNELKIQNIKLYKIKVLIINEKFKIETVDKKFYYSKIAYGGKDGWIEIESDSAKLVTQITNIFQLVSVDKNFLHRLTGSFTAGFSFTKSNSIGQMNFSGNVRFATKRMEYAMNFSSISSLDSGKFSRDNENLQASASYDLNSTWYLSGIGQYQRNLELSIARRFVEILGIGNKLIIRQDWQLTALTGVDFTQQLSTEGVNSAPQLEIPVMFRFFYYKFRHPDIQISTTQTVYFSLADNGRIRYDGTTSFSWQLIRYFYLTSSPYTNYDSSPPLGSSSNFDFGVVVGISYKF